MEITKLAFASCLSSPLTNYDRWGNNSRSQRARRNGNLQTSFLPTVTWQLTQCSTLGVFTTTSVPRMVVSRDTEPDINNDAVYNLETTLDALARKMTIMPATEDQDYNKDEEANVSAEVEAKLEAMQVVTGIPSGFSSSNKEFSTIEEQIVYSLTSETHALEMSNKDVDDFTNTVHGSFLQPFLDEDSPDDVGQNQTGHYDDEDEFSEDIVYKSRKCQTSPRVLDGVRLRSTRDAIRRRRDRLAAKRGEYARREPELELSELDRDGVVGLGGASTINSLHNARPFAPHSLQNDVEVLGEGERENVMQFGGGALVAAAALHVKAASRAPTSYHPFPGLQDAFYRADHPPCQRCSMRAHYKQLALHAGICSDCYTEIYLRTPPGESLTAQEPSFITPTQARLNEIRLEREAAQVVRNIVANTASSDSSASSPTSPPPMPYSPTSVIPGGRDGAFGKHGNGGGVSSGSSADSAFGFADNWQVAASARSLRTINPIRNLVQNIQVKPNPSKDVIKLSIGDPTVYGNLEVSDRVINTLASNLKDRITNGYSLSMGSVEARGAVAERYSTKRSPLTVEDVFLTSGTSGALELVLGALANEGDNILLPRPGFPLFRTLAENLGIECRFYQLDPQREWQAELGDISSNTDHRTRAIVVNNPSNPCGSVFSREHIDDIISVASALRVPIVADEVYANMVFSPATFTSFGEASTDVPVFAVGGVSKQFVVPGWRLGWVLVHDRNKVLERAGVLKGMRQLTTRMLVPNTPAQTVLPAMLDDTSGFDAVMSELRSNAEFAMERMQGIPGLTTIRPRGAMYMMVHVNVQKMSLKDDMDFVEKLLEEEAVFALPGRCFQAPNYVRVVFAAPKEILGEAFQRMKAFCTRRISDS